MYMNWSGSCLCPNLFCIVKKCSESPAESTSFVYMELWRQDGGNCCGMLYWLWSTLAKKMKAVIGIGLFHFSLLNSRRQLSKHLISSLWLWWVVNFTFTKFEMLRLDMFPNVVSSTIRGGQFQVKVEGRVSYAWSLLAAWSSVPAATIPSSAFSVERAKCSSRGIGAC